MRRVGKMSGFAVVGRCAQTLRCSPRCAFQKGRWLSFAKGEKVDVGAVSVERVREFGSVYLPLALWHRLGLGKLLGEVIEPGREAVDWPTVASVLVSARFCARQSELAVAEDWYEKTALEDILGVEKGRINERPALPRPRCAGPPQGKALCPPHGALPGLVRRAHGVPAL